MAEEYIKTVEPDHGTAGSNTHTTIIKESGSSGGGAGWLIALVLLIAVIAGIYLFTQTSASEAVKDNAIAEAASDVGNAASQVGNAAQRAADSVAK